VGFFAAARTLNMAGELGRILTGGGV